MEKALVTGGAGFIGSGICKSLLSEGMHVTCIDCFRDYYPKELKLKNIQAFSDEDEFTLIDSDITSLHDYPDVDYVFHVAAQPGVRKSWGSNFDIYLKDNIESSQKLLEYYKDKKLKKFVYSSSSSVYGDAPLPMKEDMVCRPYSPYGVTKLAAENLVGLYSKNYGLPSVSLRYFTVYGPRQRPEMAIAYFTRQVKEDKPIDVFGDGTQTRDFTYVDDVVEANLLAARSDVKDGVFNIGGGSKSTVNDLIGLIESGTKKKAIVNNLPVEKGDIKDTHADVSSAKEMLGWSPKTDLASGVKKYILWLNENIVSDS